MDQKFKFGGTIGNGDSYLEFPFRHFKVFRRHAILHDAAGVLRAHSGKGPGYSYKIGRGPYSCLLGHVTGLLFCHYVKLFLPSIFKFVDFQSSISRIFFKKLSWQIRTLQESWVFFWRLSSRILISSSRKVLSHKTSILVYRAQGKIVW